MSRCYSDIQLFQRDRVWLTCGSPCIRFGYSNGNNDADIYEQVGLESHRGRLRGCCGRAGRREEEGSPPFINQTGWSKGRKQFTFAAGITVVAENGRRARLALERCRPASRALGPSVEAKSIQHNEGEVVVHYKLHAGRVNRLKCLQKFP